MRIRNHVIEECLRVLAKEPEATIHAVATNFNLNTDEREALACQWEDVQEQLRTESAQVTEAEITENKRIFGESGR